MDEVVEFRRVIDPQVIEDVVARFDVVPDAQQVLRFQDTVVVDLSRGDSEPVLLEVRVIALVDRGVADDREQAEDDRGQDVHEALEGMGEGRAVVRRGDGGDGGDHVAVAAFEEGRQGAVLRGLPLGFGAVREEFREHAHGGAAEAVAEQVDLFDAAVRHGLAPVGDEALLIGAAVAGVLVFLGMRDAVVDAGAGDLGVEVARAVPGAVRGTDLRRVCLDAGLAELFDQIAADHAPVGQLVHAVLFAPAHHAADPDEGVFVFVRHNDILPFRILFG